MDIINQPVTLSGSQLELVSGGMSDENAQMAALGTSGVLLTVAVTTAATMPPVALIAALGSIAASGMSISYGGGYGYTGSRASNVGRSGSARRERRAAEAAAQHQESID